VSKVSKALIILLTVGLIAVLSFVIWAYTPLGPMPEALAALESDAQVTVETDPWLIFRPAGEAKSTGLILYPGGRVDPRSYAPAARAIAAAGYPTVITPMPFNLAVFGIDKADDVMAVLPEVERWAIGGHSLGGAMGAAYAHGNPTAVGGLALWAAYPASNNSLADRANLAVASIYGTLDGLATGDKIDASRPLLPDATTWVAIKGGNHAQFGWYGPQGGDNEAAITREEQQKQIIDATVQLLQRVDEAGQ
jgi:pimeloyl-ACP methyl ester carboxylesterase